MKHSARIPTENSHSATKASRQGGRHRGVSGRVHTGSAERWRAPTRTPEGGGISEMGHLDGVLDRIESRLAELSAREAGGEDVSEERMELLKNTRTGDRFVGQGSSRDYVEHISSGGTRETFKGE